MRLRVTIFAVLVVALGAEAGEPTEAARLFAEGRAAFKANDFATACPAFAKSYELEPGLGTLLNWATCLEKQGAFVTAWLRFNDAIEWAQRTHEAEREQFAREHAKVVRPQVSWLALTASGDIEVRVDGKSVRVSSTVIPYPVEVGVHDVRVEQAGFEPFVASLTVSRAGETVAQTIPPLKKIETAPPPEAVRVVEVTPSQPLVSAPPPVSIQAQAAPRRGVLAAGVGLIVGGSLVTVASVVGLIWSFSTYSLLQGQRVDATNPQVRVSLDDFNRLRWVPGLSWAGLALGATAVSVGVVLSAFASSNATYFVLTPSVGPNGFVVSGRF